MSSLLDPTILFFAFGLFAGVVKSNLEIPPAISRFLSLYLLMALGLKGGFALAHSGLVPDVATHLAIAVSMAIAIPLLSYPLLRRLVGGFDAAALAAAYGSVSAVTFITATQYLDNHGIDFGGYMVAAMALMESPAIFIGVLLANRLRAQQAAAIQINDQGTAVLMGNPAQVGLPLGKILHESVTDGAQLLLLGAMLIAFITGDTGKAAMQPFSGELFKGMLAFFMLDMGLLAARQFPRLRRQALPIVGYALAAPLLHAAVALGLCNMLDITVGNAILLMTLAASASYIAVPAALRLAIPEANPSLYLGMALGITFPFNVLVGIPMYHQLANQCL
ncbi:hypothetical protein HNQ59_002480 [Chitinivorax tropicus]|uniref:Sodium-dependent bicarbonate transport family permease n=1 Tax=Chitinivorax tropicus TaxID=714531 RepID=A0A840MQX8_9PROT|nr:sodium-dependent bicarbonate transport family permease [Chitinivorax tropicus]MBB5019182.1 hypothetical protein [Chitinivorax tropicus]